ncbi:MAG: formimidoylglutamase [Nitrospinaceae bacterium]
MAQHAKSDASPQVLRDALRPGDGGEIVLIGFPHDAGVARNGGRAGARLGPERFRAALGRYGSLRHPHLPLSLDTLSLTDAGDVPPGLTLEEAHIHLTRIVGEVLDKGGAPFVVGGGNDQSYANAKALLNRHPPGTAGVINIDAHLDVRPLLDGRAHSGSPFRQLLEDPRFSGERFVEFAAQGPQCLRDHADYVSRRGGRIAWLEEDLRVRGVAAAFRGFLEHLGHGKGPLFVSFDLDAVAAAEAPGVSCPGILGLTAQEAVDIAFAAGAHPGVALFDLSEYNPEIEEERTGRLAVALFYHFCLGLAQRRLQS